MMDDPDLMKEMVDAAVVDDGEEGVPEKALTLRPPERIWIEQLPESGDQGACESCWAWTASHVLAAHISIINGQPPRRPSVQQLMMCADSPGAPQSCDYPARGLAGQVAYTWLTRGLGNDVCTDDEAAYTEDDSPTCAQSYAKCKPYALMRPTYIALSTTSKTRTFGGTYPYGRASSTLQAERAMAFGLEHGPMGVAVDMDCFTFQAYSSGVATGCAVGQVNHAVTLGGYGECAPGSTAPPCDRGYTGTYWIVQNSWSKYWGLDGYIYFEFGKNFAGVANWPGMMPIDVEDVDWGHPDGVRPAGIGISVPGSSVFASGAALGSSSAGGGAPLSFLERARSIPPRTFFGTVAIVALVLPLLVAAVAWVILPKLRLPDAHPDQVLSLH